MKEHDFIFICRHSQKIQLTKRRHYSLPSTFFLPAVKPRPLLFSYFTGATKRFYMFTPEQNKAIVTRFNKEFIERGDRRAFDEIIAPEFINRTAPPGVPKGSEGVLYFFDQFLKPAFPDLRVEIYDQVAGEDKVATRKALHGTHKGEFFSVAPTGRNVIMEVMDIIRLKDGRFVEHWNVLDWHGVVAQLTASPVNS